MRSVTPLTSAKVFSRSEYEAMTGEERSFARQQFREIFSKEMSKVTVGMSRRQQVERNLAQLEDHTQTEHQQLLQQLNSRMISVDLKRKQQLQKRIETCKLHDDNWKGRMKRIEGHLAEQDKQAENRLKKYQNEYEKYLESRRSKTQPSQHYHPTSSRKFERKEHFRTSELSSAQETLLEARKNNSSRRLVRKRVGQSNLDRLIRQHQQKSRKLEQERQNEILQRALNKLEHINDVKKTVERKRSPSPKQLTDLQEQPKRKSSPAMKPIYRLPTEQHEQRYRRVSNDNRVHKSTSQAETSNRMLLRRKLEQEQSQRRWEQFQRSKQRDKREHILRQIRGKVAEYKLLAQRF